MRQKVSIVRLLAAACLGGLLLSGPCFGGTPNPDDVKKMEAALPEKAPATPKKARKVLVYGNAQGFVHSSIELGEETIAKMGEKTGAYTATISNDPAVFDDLSPYDAIMLVSTTGHFMLPKNAPADKDKAAEYKDKEKQRFENLIKFVKDGKGLAGIHAASDAYYDWPEWGETIGGYFNGHPWGNVTVKIDDPKSPITAGFDGKEFEMQDETYTFKKEPWSRDKLHVLTSLDFSKFSDGDKKRENRAYDHDYGISWIHEVGKGRVFYCAHGHSEHVYWDKPMLEEYLAGLQYALGDLDADATPSGAAKTASAK